MVQRVERHIKVKSNPNWKQIDNLSFAVKNLYNKANYVVRQTFFETSKEVQQGNREHAEWIRYRELDKLAKQEKWEEYRELPAQTSQQTLRLLEKNWKSFFNSIKIFKINGSLGQLINADVNGAYNILRKAIPNLFKNGVEGLGLNPIKINLNFNKGV